MDKKHFPADFSTEAFTGHDASAWANAQVLDALNKVVGILADRQDIPDKTLAEKSYQIITNEIRRRMQANVENFARLELERFYPVDKETGFIENEEEIPDKLNSVKAALGALEVLADAEEDIVHIGISEEDYMRTWNRLIERQKRRIYYYDDENDEEHMSLDD